jgi:hypothetical protein
VVARRATAPPEAVPQPRLVIRHRPRLWTPRLRSFTAFAATAGVLGLVLLLVTGNALLPFQATVVLKGKSGSKGDLFADPEVRRILLRHHLRVEVTQTGSREAATGPLEGYDFMFPSGRPAGNMIKERLAREKGYSPNSAKPFATPLVFATFRQYADTLVAAGVATPQPGRGLYYTLDVGRFLGLMRSQKTWDDLGLARHGPKRLSNSNRVLAHSPSACFANAGEAYLALTAFVLNGGEAPQAPEALAVAGRIKPLLTLEGLQDDDLLRGYVTPEGMGKAPIVVVYEHQYLAYQLRTQQRLGGPDSDRVLLYPVPQMLTDPEFLVLDERAEGLRRLLLEDEGLRRRAKELGYRVLDPDGVHDSEQLWAHLAAHGIPGPARDGDVTRADLPGLDSLEAMIAAVGGCVR